NRQTHKSINPSTHKPINPSTHKPLQNNTLCTSALPYFCDSNSCKFSMDIKNNILETIGNTPLIKLNKVAQPLPCTVVAKVDYFNPGNSIKDRMALKMVEVAEQEGKLKP